MKTKIFVSVVIPVRRLNKYLITECLPALERQTFRRFEVIVLPNNQSDLDQQLKKQYRWLKIITTKNVGRPAEKRDIGAKKAKGIYLAFIDDDAYPEKDWLKNAVTAFNQRPELRKKKIIAVCGPGVLPQKAGFWEKVFDEVLKSPVGSGNYNYRFTPQPQRYVNDYPSMNFLVIKKNFLKLGGFNSSYWPGEDSKLCEELISKENGLILYKPNILVYHHRRGNLFDYLKQHINYGYHRGAFFAHGDKNSRQLFYLVPTIFVFYLIILIATVLLSEYLNIQYLLFYFYLPFYLYLFLLFYFLTDTTLKTFNPFIGLLGSLVIFLTHVTYGIMFVKGLIIGLLKKEKIYD